MIDIKTIVKNLQDRLNANELDLQFQLYTDCGIYEETKRKLLTIRDPMPGVVTSMGGDFVPLKDLESYNDTLSVEIQIPVSQVAKVRELLSVYVKSIVGVTTVIDDYDVTFNITAPTVGEPDITPYAGMGVVLSFFIYMQVGKGAVMSNNIHLSIDGEQLIVLNATIATSYSVSSNTYQESSNQKSVALGQIVAIGGTIPLLKNGVTQRLKHLMITGALNGMVFDIVFNDGLTVQKWKMIPISEWSLNMSNGIAASISCSFTTAEEYNG